MNDEEVKIFVGQRIKQMRRHLGISQFALGERVDINQRQITLIEGGKSFPSLPTLNKLAQVFNCEIKEFFEYEHLRDDLTLKQEMLEMIESFSSSQIKLSYKLLLGINES